LDAADSLRQKDRQLIDHYTALSQSLFLDMFGDPVTNPMGWSVENLINVTKKIGSGATPKGGKEAYYDQGISLVRSLNIHDNLFLYKNLAFIDDDQANTLSNVTLEQDDVLLNITGASVCRCAIVPSEILPARVNQHVSIIRTEITKLNPMFLLHLVISQQFKRKLIAIASAGGATREALTKLQIENLDIFLPPIAFQNQFAERIQLIEQQKQQAQASLEKSEALFSSLLQRAFTGELTAKRAA
jgi:type I restriction enzyme, S subunit